MYIVLYIVLCKHKKLILILAVYNLLKSVDV